MVMADGVPPSEAALRRRRRQRRRAAACGVAQVVCGGAGMLAGSCHGELTTPEPAARGTDQPVQGCGGSGDLVDVRWHVVAALRCLAESLEFQGYFEVQGNYGAGTAAAEAKESPWCGQAQH